MFYNCNFICRLRVEFITRCCVFFRCHGVEMTKKSAFHVMCGKEKKLECMTMPVTSYFGRQVVYRANLCYTRLCNPFFSLHHNDFTPRAKDVGSSEEKILNRNFSTIEYITLITLRFYAAVKNFFHLFLMM